MVTGFQDDLDTEDEEVAKQSLSTIPSQDVDLSSDDEPHSETVIKGSKAEDAVKPSLVPSDTQPNSGKMTSAKPDVAENSAASELDLGALEAQSSQKKRSGPVIIKNRLDNSESSEDDADDDAAPVVTVLADEDISDEDTTSSKPADSGLATDTTQVSQSASLNLLASLHSK